VKWSLEGGGPAGLFVILSFFGKGGGGKLVGGGKGGVKDNHGEMGFRD